MGIYLNKGNDAFKKALSRRIYVDKSMLISKTNHAIEHDDPFWCVTRLRSSGKTMALEMLNAYYSKGCDSRELFHGLKIENDPSFEKHLNKHNVISIDMNGAFSKYPNSPLFISELEKAVEEELKSAFPTITFHEKDGIADAIAKSKLVQEKPSFFSSMNGMWFFAKVRLTLHYKINISFSFVPYSRVLLWQKPST